MRSLLKWVICLSASLAADAHAINSIRFSAEEIIAGEFSAKATVFDVTSKQNRGMLRLSLPIVSRGKDKWLDNELRCDGLRVNAQSIQCPRGRIKALGETASLSAEIKNDRSFDLTVTPRPAETWRVVGTRSIGQWKLKAEVKNADVVRFASLVPAPQPKPSKGSIDAIASGLLRDDGSLDADADLALKQIHFSDAEGLHAGEKIDASVRAAARGRGYDWRWNTEIDWRGGEIFWQPLYFGKAGHRIVANGESSREVFKVVHAEVLLQDIGRADLSGRWDIRSSKPLDFTFRAKDVILSDLYSILLKPFLEKTPFNALQATGRATVDWRFAKGETQVFDLKLANTTVTDENKRFSIAGLSVQIPWVNDKPANAVIAFDGAQMGNIPIGRVALKPQLSGYGVIIPSATVPILDGALKLEDVRAKRVNEEWTWQFNAELLPTSLPKLTKALGWPEMAGSLSGVIPRVRFADNQLDVGGAIQFKVFDGTVVANNMTLSDPFGRAPRLSGGLYMSNLDLEVLTRTFSFGKMLGRIDLVVENMELANWRPARFDARVMSSPGDYPRKISQQAVQNISSLGGAGAGAAIQRSLLRIFEQFGYRKIGLSCELRNNICKMGGVSDTPQGYVIVQGGGIPSITVMGYNRIVSWEEFLGRVRGAIQSNTKPVVQ